MAEEKKGFRCKLSQEHKCDLPDCFAKDERTCLKFNISCKGTQEDVEQCPEWADKEWPLYAVDCKTGNVIHIKNSQGGI